MPLVHTYLMFFENHLDTIHFERSRTKRSHHLILHFHTNKSQVILNNIQIVLVNQEENKHMDMSYIKLLTDLKDTQSPSYHNQNSMILYISKFEY